MSEAEKDHTEQPPEAAGLSVDEVLALAGEVALPTSPLAIALAYGGGL